MSTIDTASAFGSATNERSPSARFANHGDKYSGTITRVGEFTGPNQFSGKEETSVTIDLDLGDEIVTLWCRTHIDGDVVPGGITRAIADAVRENTGRSGLPVEGARLAVEYYADGQASKAGMSPPKLYRARYEAPTSTSASQQGGPFDAPATQPAPAPQQAAPQPAAEAAPATAGPSALDF